MPERLCANSSCQCAPGPDTIYCSVDCEAVVLAENGVDRACACGHPECRPKNLPADQPDPVAQPTR